MLLEIKALDTLFFRDGKPFSWGEETWAEGIFPPYPSSFYGALRSLWFAENIKELKKANTQDDPTKSIRINGIFIKRENTLYFPLPLDLVKRKEEKENKIFSLNLFKNSIFIANLNKDFQFLTTTSIDKVESPEGFIRFSNFKKYLLGDLIQEVSFLPKKEFYKSEPKIGIARNSLTHTSEEGKLYRINMVRFKEGVSLVVDIELGGIELPKDGFKRLGAEGKIVVFKFIERDEVRKLKEEIKEELKEQIKKTKCFKLCLLTPAIFENGYLPKETYSGLKLVGCICGKPVYVGGFDIKRKEPKTMYRAVPAGSVYYFILEQSSTEELLERFHYKHISDYKKEEGFGLSVVGGW